MARKDRAPTPPKRPQGPRPRTAQHDDDARRRVILYAAAASGIVALVAVIVLLTSMGGGGGGTGDPTKALEAAGCAYKISKAAKYGQHVNSLQAKVKYSTFPPASGKHYYIPAVWGFYTDAVSELQAVHNLEHGGIVINWGDKVPQSQVEQVQRFYDGSPDAMLAFPLPKLGNKLALVSWTEKPDETVGQNRIALCPRFDEAAFKAFRDSFRGKGPERFPVDQLIPGT